MPRYNTVQREKIVRFLTTNKDSAMTISDITSGMKRIFYNTRCPAESTVYRLVKILVEEGKVKRTVNGFSREFLYQIVEDDNTNDHLYIKCKKCGRLFRIDESNEILIDALLEREGFYLDRCAVLIGLCMECKEI